MDVFKIKGIKMDIGIIIFILLIVVFWIFVNRYSKRDIEKKKEKFQKSYINKKEQY